jgi:hypothetical protein
MIMFAIHNNFPVSASLAAQFATYGIELTNIAGNESATLPAKCYAQALCIAQAYKAAHDVHNEAGAEIIKKRLCDNFAQIRSADIAGMVGMDKADYKRIKDDLSAPKPFSIGGLTLNVKPNNKDVEAALFDKIAASTEVGNWHKAEAAKAAKANELEAAKAEAEAAKAEAEAAKAEAAKAKAEAEAAKAEAEAAKAGKGKK